MTSEENPVASGQRPIKEASDWEVNSLLDRHLFGNGIWCWGNCAWSGAGYRCECCGALPTPTITQQIFGREKHLRQIPRYSFHNVVEAMERRSRKTQIYFVLALRIAILGPEMSAQRSATSEIQRLLFGMTPRAVGVAALQALGVVDHCGYFSDPTPESSHP